MKFAILFNINGKKLHDFESKIKSLAAKEGVDVIYQLASFNPIRLKIPEEYLKVNQRYLDQYKEDEEI